MIDMEHKQLSERSGDRFVAFPFRKAWVLHVRQNTKSCPYKFGTERK